MRSTSYRFHMLAALVAGALISQTTHAGEVNGLATFADGTPAKAVEVNGNFTAIQGAVNANNTRLGTVEAASTAHGASITTINSKNTAQDTSIGTLNTTTADHETRITAVENVSDTHTVNLDALGTTVSGNTASINTLNTTTGDHTSSITAIVVKNTAQDSSISSINSTNTTQNGSIAALETRLDTLESQVLATLTYPQIMTTDYRIAIAAGIGVVSYVGGDNVIMAGKILKLPTFSLNTVANKIYHLRFEAGAWKLFDTTNTAYNPGGVAEYNVVFDSRSDSMLVARVTTDGSNSPTVDSLANKDRLQFTVNSNVGCVAPPPKDGVEYPFSDINPNRLTGIVKSAQRTFRFYASSNDLSMLEKVVLNWARTPVSYSYSNNEGLFGAGAGNFNALAYVRENIRYRMEGEGYWVVPTTTSCIDVSVVMSGQN